MPKSEALDSYIKDMDDTKINNIVNNLKDFELENFDTQDGIKAAAATLMDGRGGGAGFDYLYDVPIKDIDLNFDKPFMFLIRDKETGETWFVGTVYEPLLWEDEELNSSEGHIYLYLDFNNN